MDFCKFFFAASLALILIIGNILAAWAAVGILSALTGFRTDVCAIIYIYTFVALVFRR
jgi:hypothetical protein